MAFVKGRWLCLVTDWRRIRIGYVLWQKGCKCQQIHPSCCQGGWVIIMVGSRFCMPTESQYALIEGELLGVTWALAKTAHYTFGCPQLLVLVDHKPLLGLLTYRGLVEINNPRLETIPEKTMRWSFKIEHVAGAKKFGPDALSQIPGHLESVSVSLSVLEVDVQLWLDDIEAAVLSNVRAQSEIQVVSWV